MLEPDEKKKKITFGELPKKKKIMVSSFFFLVTCALCVFVLDIFYECDPIDPNRINESAASVICMEYFKDTYYGKYYETDLYIFDNPYKPFERIRTKSWIIKVLGRVKKNQYSNWQEVMCHCEVSTQNKYGDDLSHDNITLFDCMPQ